MAKAKRAKEKGKKKEEYEEPVETAKRSTTKYSTAKSTIRTAGTRYSTAKGVGKRLHNL